MPPRLHSTSFIMYSAIRGVQEWGKCLLLPMSGENIVQVKMLHCNGGSNVHGQEI